MRAKRQSVAVIAAIASLIAGALFSRFLRRASVARIPDQIADAGRVPAAHAVLARRERRRQRQSHLLPRQTHCSGFPSASLIPSRLSVQRWY
jgi:hypothetical protein